MGLSLQRLPPVIVPLLLAVAVLGYLTGLQRVSATPAAQAPAGEERVAAGADLSLEYPSGWRQQAGAKEIPGMALEHPLFLAPAGTGVQAGLEAGVLAGTSPGPLPASLVGRLRGLPSVEVVGLVALQALRYTDVSLSGYTQELELYAIPTPVGAETVLACHAPAADARLLRRCGEIVATLSLAGQSTSDITPDSAYGARLGALVDALDGARRQARLRMGRAGAPALVAALAGGLARRLAATAVNLGHLEAPPVAAAAQVLLLRSMADAGGAYEQLARAARSHSAAAFARARAGVARAEAAVDRALENFALLGYGRAY